MGQIPLAQLRNMIQHFQRLDDWLGLLPQSGRLEITDDNRAATKELDVSASVLEVCLLPGISTFVTISSQGLVTMISKQGNVLDSWQYLGRVGFSQVTTTMSDSQRYGPLLLIICDILPSSCVVSLFVQ